MGGQGRRSRRLVTFPEDDPPPRRDLTNVDAALLLAGLLILTVGMLWFFLMW